MKELIHKLITNPKRIFLIDGLGALLTLFSLALITSFNGYFGIPKPALTVLSTLAFFLCVYSMYCFVCIPNNWRKFLTVLSTVNLLYCLLTLGLVIYYFEQFTVFAISYFSLEIL